MRLILTALLLLTSLYPLGVAAQTSSADNEEILSWLSSPDVNDTSHVFTIIAGLEENNILELISTAKTLPLGQKLLLAGILAQHEEYEAAYNKCLASASDIEKAICISAYHEWAGQRNLEFADKEQKLAIELLNSEKPEASQIVALTLASTDYYSPKIVEQVIQLLKQVQDKKESISHYMSQGALESMTNTSAKDMDDQQIVAHFEKWLENNRQKLKPSSTQINGEKLNYTNTLHSFALNLPSSYQRVRALRYIQGKRCFFADEFGRSISVETHPKRESLEAAFIEVKANSQAVKQKEITVNNLPAIQYTVEVPAGKFVGLLIKMENQTTLATAYSPVEKDSNEDMENLLKSLSII